MAASHVSERAPTFREYDSQISLFSLPFLPFVLEAFFEMRLVFRNGIAPMVAVFPASFDMPFKRRAVAAVEFDEERAASL